MWAANGLNIGITGNVVAVVSAVGLGAGAFVQKGVASCAAPPYNVRRR